MIISTFLLQHVQMCMSRPRNINVFQWKRECLLSALRVELDFQGDDDECNLLRSTKNRHELLRHPLFHLLVESCPNLKFCSKIFTPLQVVPALEGVLGIRGFFLTILLYRLLLVIQILRLCGLLDFFWCRS